MQKKYCFLQNGCLSNLAILYDLCIDIAQGGKSTCTTAFAETNCLQNIDTLNICMKKFDAKNLFYHNDSFVNLAIFFFFFAFKWGFCLCLDSAYTGKSTCTKAFTEAVWYFAQTV